MLALEAAAAEGAAWTALEDRVPLDQGAGVARVLRPAVWTLDWEAPGGSDEDDGDHEDEVLVMKAADGRTDACFVLAVGPHLRQIGWSRIASRSRRAAG